MAVHARQGSAVAAAAATAAATDTPVEEAAARRQADQNKVEADVTFMVSRLAEVLKADGYGEVAARLPWVNGAADSAAPASAALDIGQRRKLVQALSLSFQLLNMVEENAAAQGRRHREGAHGLAAENGLFGSVFARLGDRGLNSAQAAELLASVHVEPVLTAHPTEAKRQTMVEQLRELYLLLFKRESTVWTKWEQDQITSDIQAALAILWRTGDLRLKKLDVTSERRAVQAYLRHKFPAVLPQLDARLRTAFEDAGFDGALVRSPGSLPRISFGSWVGGDRDGHPGVTASVTAETLLELRQGALDVHRAELEKLVAKLSLSARRAPPPSMLLNALAEANENLAPLRKSLPAGAWPTERNPGEPWREMIGYMLLRLPTSAEALASGLHYTSPAELLADLQILGASLDAVGAGKIADTHVAPIERAVQVFGFHLAALDVRENSTMHEHALWSLLSVGGVSLPPSAGEWDEASRVEVLNRELDSLRPLAHPHAALAPQAKTVLDAHRVVARHASIHGIAGIGSFIVSMTRSLSDLLAVYVLGKESGLVGPPATLAEHFGSGSGSLGELKTEPGNACIVPVVPLFETVGDLERSPEIMSAFLAHPVTQRSLALQQAIHGYDRPRCQVMVGYSDSCKDGGILSSQWHLHVAQRKLSQVCADAGVDVVFFHGRGGTVSRGAGPTHRFLDALPVGGPEAAAIRVTEQGESIAAKYSNVGTATYNLELLTAGVTGVAARGASAASTEHELAPVVEDLAKRAHWAYAELISHPQFMTYFSEGTPIDALEHGVFGSRPSRRTGQRTLADLRAIPWTFAWTQSRVYLPSWYGVGTVLHELAEAEPHNFERFRAAVRDWPFLQYVIGNIEASLASVSLPIVRDYGSLVSSDAARDAIGSLIHNEFVRTDSVLQVLYDDVPLALRRPRMHHTVQLRDRGLRELHAEQIALLKHWRGLVASGDSVSADAVLPPLLSTVNAIASGLRTTG
ncbi:phosphoenolpyruvate carboxylase [Thecamonas trahens ATCC 50062]|uniref:Phosphoenolpyruvate carboxylase n=1 Tax=Thecamonas trahens ATCC 50062 TaxID=461836 RepID=A0A0L0D7A9_THETB|nr:phosphoenolpyruvate carboxylase [Thecamonas trahens ATCC 50062]KNC48272.1 phosphoenolpyruvate carboxylase [Thecamonas trahens ATCC 50062]|eukprot:XP_013758839.1 phosphoenolpyruvate carboxylase [Thecamonas trahens ATCC 50062]